MAITFGIGTVFAGGMYYVKKEKERGMYRVLVFPKFVSGQHS